MTKPNAQPIDEREPRGPTVSTGIAAAQAAPGAARKAARDGETLTLAQHLALGYEFIVYGRRKDWSPDTFAEQMKADEALKTEAETKLAALSAVIRARREGACHVTTTQARVLSDALAKAREQG